MAKLVPLPKKLRHSGIEVNVPYSSGRILEHRAIARALMASAVRYSNRPNVGSALMNMAGDIFVSLMRATNSDDMTESYRECAMICYEKASLISNSRYSKPYVDQTRYVNGLASPL